MLRAGSYGGQLHRLGRAENESAPNRITRRGEERLKGAYSRHGIGALVQDQPFDYGQGAARHLASALTAARFATYLEACGNDSVAAIRLYTWNTAIAASFYGPLQALEVTLRNSVHAAMAAGYGNDWILDSRHLRGPEVRRVEAVVGQLGDRSRTITPDRVVAELSYGFWVALFANAYDTTLWRSDLHRIFRPKVRDRHGLHMALDQLRTLRNRIAHHEPIFGRKLREDHMRILHIVGFLHQPTLVWVQHHTTVPTLLSIEPANLQTF